MILFTKKLVIIMLLASAYVSVALARTAKLGSCSGEALSFNSAKKACKSGDFAGQIIVTCNNKGKEKDRRLCNSDGEKKGIYLGSCSGVAIDFNSLNKACLNKDNAGKLLVKCKKGKEKDRRLCNSDGEKKGIYIGSCSGVAIDFSSLTKACQNEDNAGKTLVKCKKGKEKDRRLCHSDGEKKGIYLSSCTGVAIDFSSLNKACKDEDNAGKTLVKCKKGKEKDRRLCNSDGEKKGIYLGSCGGVSIDFSSLRKACKDEDNAGKLLVKCKKGKEKKRKRCESSGVRNNTLVLESNSPLGIAATSVRARFPKLKDARKSKTPKFIGSHTKTFGTGHAELAGFGITMISHNGHKPIVKYDKILHASGELDKPNLLFFEKASGKKIIGMGYSFEFDPDNPPQLEELEGFPHVFLIHEAGYHPLTNGGFNCATNSDLKKYSYDSGRRVDDDGLVNITRDDLKGKSGTVKHGRIWTLHVWFDPQSGRPAIADTDPWYRYGSRSKAVSNCAFRYQN